MSIYYIELNDGTLFSLNSTSNVDLTLPSQISSFPTEEGGFLSDNVVLQPRVITVEGSISDVKNLKSGNSLTSKESIDLLNKVRDEQQLFTFYYGNDITPLDNCIFDNISISQGRGATTFTALLGTYSSYNIRFTLKQIRVATVLTQEKIRDEEIEDITKRKKSTNGSTTFADEKFETKTVIPGSADIFKKSQEMLVR